MTSSRQFNKAVLPVPQFVQPAPAVVQQTYAPQYAVAAPVPVKQVVQHTYLPPPPPAPVPQVVQHTYLPPPAPVVQQQVVQHTYAPQYTPVAPVAQIQQQVAVASPIYGAPAAAVAAKLVQPAIAVSGKKQNPLTFAYSYDQGSAKVSHSYSGSGW